MEDDIISLIAPGMNACIVLCFKFFYVLNFQYYIHNCGTNKKLFVVLKSKTLRTTSLNKNCSLTIILFVLSLSCTTQMKKMVCACLGVRRGRNQPSQIRFVEKIKALECLSPSFYLPRALTPPTCLEEETRGGFKSGDLGGRELKEHHRTMMIH